MEWPPRLMERYCASMMALRPDWPWMSPGYEVSAIKAHAIAHECRNLWDEHKDLEWTHRLGSGHDTLDNGGTNEVLHRVARLGGGDATWSVLDHAKRGGLRTLMSAMVLCFHHSQNWFSI